MKLLKLNENDLENIKKLYFEDKINFKKIGIIYNCSESTVNSFLKKHGVIKRISNSLRKKISDSEIENIKILYYKDLLSFSKISNIYNCSDSCVILFFKRHNLIPRNPSESNKLSWNENRKIKMSNSMKGKKICLGKRWKMNYKVNKNNSGQNNPMWKGGKTEIKLRLRNSYEYKKWRTEIYKRDNFTCQVCSDNSGGNLNAHHKVSFSELLIKYNITTFEEGLNCKHIWDVDNGITLCEKCHKQTDSYLYNPYAKLRERNEKGQFNSTKIKH